MYGYIYKFTLIPTGMIYIGQHKSPKFDTKYVGSGTRWLDVISNYSLDDLKCEILEVIDDNYQINEDYDYITSRERYWVDYYNSTNPDIGYNLVIPSKSFFRGHHHSDEVKQKCREVTRNYNLTRKDYTQLSEQHKGSKMLTNGVEQHWFYGDNIEKMKAEGWYEGSCKARNRDYSLLSEMYKGTKRDSFTTKDKVAIYNIDTLERTFKDKNIAAELVASGKYNYGLKPKK